MKLLVRAKEGLKCPRELLGFDPITADAAVEVADTGYYRRRISEGSLICEKEIADEAPKDSRATPKDEKPARLGSAATPATVKEEGGGVTVADAPVTPSKKKR